MISHNEYIISPFLFSPSVLLCCQFIHKALVSFYSKPVNFNKQSRKTCHLYNFCIMCFIIGNVFTIIVTPNIITKKIFHGSILMNKSQHS